MRSVKLCNMNEHEGNQHKREAAGVVEDGCNLKRILSSEAGGGGDDQVVHGAHCVMLE